MMLWRVVRVDMRPPSSDPHGAWYSVGSVAGTGFFVVAYTAELARVAARDLICDAMRIPRNDRQVHHVEVCEQVDARAIF